jgi:hypothetical protein
VQVFVDGLLSKADYEHERAMIEGAEAKLNASMLASTASIGEVVLSFARTWENATAAERKVGLRLLFQRIEVEDKKVVRIFPHPRLEALLRATGSPLLVAGGSITVASTVTMKQEVQP